MTSLIIIDDSKFIRTVLRKILSQHPQFSILAEAEHGLDGLKKIQEHKPDIVILDVEMPYMNGLELLKEVKKQQHRPRFLLFSAHTKKHAQITIDCLLAGGSDYICKPQHDPSLSSLQEELLEKLTNLSSKFSTTSSPKPPSPTPILPPSLICIATSTGGPDTLKTLFEQLEPDFSIPIMIVQHMPPLFTKLLAQTLSRQAQRNIVEAQEHARIQKNDIILAKGGTHLVIHKQDNELYYRSSAAPPVHGLRPAADLLFSSAAIAVGSRTLGIVLTGMGQDGTNGAKAIHESGGNMIIQDKQSAVIWGMPGSVVRSNIPVKEKNISDIAQTLNKFVII